jgi:chemotaxis protein histidine kinase CheA
MDTEALRKSLLSKFREVTSDRLEKIGLALLALEKDPSAEAPAEDVARELHTMKGEARMLALPRIGELAHACEDVLKAARDGRSSIEVATDMLLQASDLISELLETVDAAEKPNKAVEALLHGLAEAAAGHGASEAAKPAAPAAPAAAPTAAPAAAPVPAAAAAACSEPSKPAPAHTEPARPAAQAAPAAHVPHHEEHVAEPIAARSIRVAVDALDLLGALAGDLLVEGARANLRSQELAGLIQRVNRMNDRFLALSGRMVLQMPELAASAAELEGDLHLLRDDTFRFVRKNADGVNALRGYLERLAEKVAEARLVPLSTVFTAFPRAVRDIARQQGKEVELTIGNAEVGVDRGLLGEVRDAMVHVLRNAVDHGIESPEERERLGKPRKGTIAVTVHADGDMLAVEVGDDGHGIDPAKLKETAVARGVLSATQAAGLSEREAIDLVFLPGFSTREQVTDISGRGVGMSVVRKKVEALGGSVAIITEVGKGTTIAVRLPQSMALMRVLLVRLGEAVYGIRAADVQAVGRVKPQDRVTVAGREAVEFRGQPTTLVDLAPLLHLKPGPHRDSPPVVFVQHGDDRAAFAVDELIDEREVAVKPCGGEFLKGAPCIGGAAALEDGSVAVLLHVPDMILEIRKTSGRHLAATQAQERRLKILLVDDSPIARATESAIVRALGHTVDEAIDGENGLEKLAMGTYDLVISDIQMPKMDGIELTRRIKGDPATASIPVVVLSSLAAPEDKRRGLDAGADAYLVKGELSPETMAQTLGRLVS